MAPSDDSTTVATELAPAQAFDVACRMVVDYLAASVPMGAWAVTRVAAGQQTILVTADRSYGLEPGVGGPWSTSMCHTMIAGRTPRVVPDTAVVPGLAEAVGVAASLDIPIGAYVGTPIVHRDGDLFGTVIGLNQRPLPADELADEGLLDLLTSLLSSVLDADTSATESARALERAVVDSETDPLTGLLNRRGWERWLAREEDRFQRFGDPAAVVVFDLDRLKAVNDTEGHDAGDRYIRRAAEALRHATRVAEPVARLGGDEFALVAPVDADGATSLIQRLRGVLDEAGTPCSIGLAPFTVADGFDGACTRADAAMYDDKRARRAQVMPDAARGS